MALFWVGVNTRSLFTLAIVSVALVLVSGYLLITSFSREPQLEISGSGWDAAAAIGTVAATIVALGLAVRSFRQERDAVARLVSAWVTDEYSAMRSVPAYRRSAIVHVANQSNEPVFDAHVSVVAGVGNKSLGPLSAPTPIAVVPARGVRSFDISTPLLGHEDTWNLRVELTFADARGKRWLRNVEGGLTEITDLESDWRPHEETELDLTDLHNLNHPLGIAAAFLAGLQDGDQVVPEKFAVVLAPEAEDWDKADWSRLRTDLEEFTPTSMVDYPAPYIARVKLSGDPELRGKAVAGSIGIPLANVIFMTLTYAPNRGWRVWGIGAAVRPDEILFPSGTFDADRGV
ncbi:hypothetical protein D6T64_01030 [Cryobacterium melibiosiphilum]|uniref:Uncharacterized protein n=1 Tax=Cryobacterium melibiosiphilum TaxID=995039 RepID=A0A3A5MRV9_9MICO|nr:hypothetical protein [Cryobacterium melibiosiphilum]RJT91911.1 hypothetical protein D6T64_01030 [Cryobacterium melibiosiphilum]